MRATVARWTAAAALTALCTLPLSAAPSPGRARPAPAAATAAEPHPQINAAIRALVRAREHLKNAAHDFGGHRVAAIGAIDAALVQLKLALEYDKD
jgi:hypothetical protein